jgi:hypothetical protein
MHTKKFIIYWPTSKNAWQKYFFVLRESSWRGRASRIWKEVMYDEDVAGGEYLQTKEGQEKRILQMAGGGKKRQTAQ